MLRYHRGIPIGVVVHKAGPSIGMAAAADDLCKDACQDHSGVSDRLNRLQILSTYKSTDKVSRIEGTSTLGAPPEEPRWANGAIRIRVGPKQRFGSLPERA